MRLGPLLVVMLILVVEASRSRGGIIRLRGAVSSSLGLVFLDARGRAHKRLVGTCSCGGGIFLVPPLAVEKEKEAECDGGDDDYATDGTASNCTNVGRLLLRLWAFGGFGTAGGGCGAGGR